MTISALTVTRLLLVQGRGLAEKAVLDLEQQDDSRLLRSVEAGLANAQARVLPDAGPSTSTEQASQQPGRPTTASSSSQSTDTSPSQTHASDQTAGPDNSQPDYGKGSTLSADEKQKAAVSSVE